MAEPDLTELAVILQDTLGRIDNTIIVTAPPAADLGSIGAVAIDLQNNLIYGPKTTSGWGVGRPTVGGTGPAGTITSVTIEAIPHGSPPEVVLGGTPSARTILLKLPAALDGIDGTNGTDGIDGTNGVDGTDGIDGANGWTPIEANVADGERRVKRVVDWVGGTGTKPATGKYVGPAGLVDTAAEATDVRGPGGSGSGDMQGANNLSDLTDDVEARTNLDVYSKAQVDTAVAGCATDGELSLLQGDVDDLAAAVGAISVPVKATGAELRAGTNDAKFATAKALADEAAWVEVTTSGAWAPDFAAGRNFSVILSGALTFNAPTNMADGQSGAIRFQQDATGGRTIGVNAAIKKVGSYTLSTAANAVDRCGYIVKGAVLELTALEKGIA